MKKSENRHFDQKGMAARNLSSTCTSSLFVSRCLYVALCALTVIAETVHAEETEVRKHGKPFKGETITRRGSTMRRKSEDEVTFSDSDS